jgi:hypothetical protein
MNPSDVIAEEEYEESLYDQMSALKKNNDASKYMTGKGLSGFHSLASSIVQSPDRVKPNVARRDPIPVALRKSFAREKTQPLELKPEAILI